MENHPPFRKIATSIRNKILAGEKGYQPGDKLPPQRQLAAQYNVARDTLRDAISLLEGERLLVKPVHNQPAEVAPTDPRVDGLEDRARNLRVTGKILAEGEECSILESTTVPCPAEIAPLLDMEVGDDVLRRTRVVRKHNRPISVSWSYFPGEAVDVTPELATTENIESGARELAAFRMNSVQEDREEWLTSRIPNDEERKLLEITGKYDTVMNVLRRVTLLDGRVVEAAMKVSPGSIPIGVRGKMS